MNLGQLVQDVYTANENLIRNSISLSGTVFNKAVETIGLKAKQEAVIPAAPPLTISESSTQWRWKYVILAGAVGVGGFLLYRRFRRPTRQPDTPHVENFEQDVVYLFQFPRCYGVPNLSPYALKLETWLRFMDLNYKMVEDISVFHRSSEGTLPYVELNGEVIVDSANIMDVLPHKLGRKSMEANLSAEQKAVGRAFETMIEMSLNFCVAKNRYDKHIGEMLQMLPSSFGFLQPLINLFIKWSVRPMALKRIRDVGIGRHSDELVEKISFSDLQALSDQLGVQHYLNGVRPTRADATLFAALALILYVPFDNPQRRFVNENFPNLRDFADRIRQRYWPDWVEVTSLLKTNTDWKRRRPASRPASSVQ